MADDYGLLAYQVSLRTTRGPVDKDTVEYLKKIDYYQKQANAAFHDSMLGFEKTAYSMFIGRIGAFLAIGYMAGLNVFKPLWEALSAITKAVFDAFFVPFLPIVEQLIQSIQNMAIDIEHTVSAARSGKDLFGHDIGKTNERMRQVAREMVSSVGVMAPSLLVTIPAELFNLAEALLQQAVAALWKMIMASLRSSDLLGAIGRNQLVRAVVKYFIKTLEVLRDFIRYQTDVERLAKARYARDVEEGNFLLKGIQRDLARAKKVFIDLAHRVTDWISNTIDAVQDINEHGLAYLDDIRDALRGLPQAVREALPNIKEALGIKIDNVLADLAFRWKWGITYDIASRARYVIIRMTLGKDAAEAWLGRRTLTKKIVTMATNKDWLLEAKNDVQAAEPLSAEEQLARARELIKSDKAAALAKANKGMSTFERANIAVDIGMTGFDLYRVVFEDQKNALPWDFDPSDTGGAQSLAVDIGFLAADTGAGVAGGVVAAALTFPFAVLFEYMAYIARNTYISGNRFAFDPFGETSGTRIVVSDGKGKFIPMYYTPEGGLSSTKPKGRVDLGPISIDPERTRQEYMRNQYLTLYKNMEPSIGMHYHQQVADTLPDTLAAAMTSPGTGQPAYGITPDIVRSGMKSGGIYIEGKFFSQGLVYGPPAPGMDKNGDTILMPVLQNFNNGQIVLGQNTLDVIRAALPPDRPR